MIVTDTFLSFAVRLGEGGSHLLNNVSRVTAQSSPVQPEGDQDFH